MIPLGDSPRLRKPSVITPLLILINLGVYLYMIFGGHSFSFYIARWGVVPSQINKAFLSLPVISPVFWTLITSIFVHGGLWHFIGNMLFLWVFGDNVEDRLGKILFLLFYLLGGFFAFLAQFLQNPGSLVPLIGASGSVSAVMGAYIYLYPSASVVTMIPIFFVPIILNIPAFYFLLFWFGNQILNASLGTLGVGWLAHIGGFVFGILFAVVFFSKRRRSGQGEIIFPR